MKISWSWWWPSLSIVLVIVLSNIVYMSAHKWTLDWTLALRWNNLLHLLLSAMRSNYIFCIINFICILLCHSDICSKLYQLRVGGISCVFIVEAGSCCVDQLEGVDVVDWLTNNQCCEIQIKYYSEAQWPPSGQTRYCWLVWLMRLILSAYPLITKQFPTCAKKYLILINSQLLYHILTLLLSVNDFCEPVYIQSTAAQRF